MEGLGLLKLPIAIAAMSIPSAVAAYKASEQRRRDREKQAEEQKEAFGKGMEAMVREISAW